MKNVLDSENDQFWNNAGKDELDAALKMVPNINIAKVMFIKTKYI